MSDDETWRPIPHWPGYEASSLGRIRSVDRTVRSKRGPMTFRGRVIKAFPNPMWQRMQVRLSVPGRQRTELVAALVLSAFAGPRPPGMEVCHNDGDLLNDRADNLRWDTRSGNMQDSIRHGTHANAAKTHCKHGHPLSGDNLRISRHADGTIKQRVCRACEVAALARYATRKLAELEAGEPRK